MDPATIAITIAGILKTVVDLGPTVIKAVEDAAPFAEEIVSLFSGGTAAITQAKLDALEAKVDDLVSQLEQPLPPDDGSTTS